MPVKITPALLRSWTACWSDEEIEIRFRKRKSVSITKVAADEVIKLDDRLWVMCRYLAHLDPTAARLFAIESAGLVAHLAGGEGDKARYFGLMNEMRQIQLEMAAEDRAGAFAAVWAVARDAARDEAWSSAKCAAWSALQGASRPQEWSAVWSAVDSTARGIVSSSGAWSTYNTEVRKAIARALEWLER